jgi:hypothetical protein
MLFISASSECHPVLAHGSATPSCNPADMILCRAWIRGLRHANLSTDWRQVVLIHLYAWRTQPTVSASCATKRLLDQFVEGGALFTPTDREDLTSIISRVFTTIPRAPAQEGDFP